MDKISFKDIHTSSLGFGCTNLTDFNSQNEAIKTLNMAFDLGVTHFDTARLYGFGKSEEILGKFIKTKRDKITITTKIGLEPVAFPAASIFFLKFAKNLVNRVSPIKRLIIKKTNGAVNIPLLTPKSASKYLDNSLKKLQTEYIDILLLHEIDFNAANLLELIDFFNEKIREGKLLHAGIGTKFSSIESQILEMKFPYDVLQIEHNVLKPNINHLPSFFDQSFLIIAHSIFKDMAFLKMQFQVNKQLNSYLKSKADIDLSYPNAISDLLLAFNKYSNPEGITIFTSRNKENIKNNIKAWASPSYSAEQVEGFVQALHAHLSVPDQ